MCSGHLPGPRPPESPCWAEVGSYKDEELARAMRHLGGFGHGVTAAACAAARIAADEPGTRGG